MNKLLFSALLLAALSTACESSPSTAPRTGIAAASSALGCTSTTEKDTEELYVQHLYVCPTPAADLDVYVFANSTARDNWVEIAESFGMVVQDKGDDWIAVTP